MKLTIRELWLLVIVIASALYGFSFVYLRQKFDEWKEMRQYQVKMEKEIDQYKRILAERDKVNQQFAELAKKLPVHPRDAKVEVYWTSIMDRIAARRGLRLIKYRRGDEEKQGIVYELPIECQEWEGNLASIVGFLFDLQSEKGMMDIRQLSIRRGDRGELRGRFLLYCAYTKEEEKKL
jgi:Tfp pilus assembly protein PilO